MVARDDQPSYTNLVYAVMRESQEPLSAAEILERVHRQRPVTTRKPINTIRSVLSQGAQLVRLGGGRYGYLPRLLKGSVLRLPLTEKKPANHPLRYPFEVLLALFPSFHEPGPRSDTEPVRATLPDGEAVPLELASLGAWGSPMPESLRGYLVANRAAAGDALLLEAVDAVAREYALRFEPQRKRDEAAVAARNKELAEAARQVFLSRTTARAVLIESELIVRLLASGFYRASVPPDPLDQVMHSDPRFLSSGPGVWALVEELSKDEIEDMLTRREWLHELLGVGDERVTAHEVSTTPLRQGMERILRDLEALFSTEQPDTQEELKALLEGAIAEGEISAPEPETPLERAQQLMYAAWEEPSRRKRLRMAREALSISPDCADAYVLLAEETARSPQKAAELYAQGLQAAERALGPQAFEGYAGAFWGVLETRPYMRARLGLAMSLSELDRREEAVEHLQEMLRLNPNDNQGLRYILVGWLFEEGHDDRAAQLLETYDDPSALWLYARALHAFRTEGDSRRARSQLTKALRGNPHVPAYLLGRRPMPAIPAPYYGFGDEDEADVVVEWHRAAWDATDGALAWLAEHSG